MGCAAKAEIGSFLELTRPDFVRRVPKFQLAAPELVMANFRDAVQHYRNPNSANKHPSDPGWFDWWRLLCGAETSWIKSPFRQLGNDCHGKTNNDFKHRLLSV